MDANIPSTRILLEAVKSKYSCSCIWPVGLPAKLAAAQVNFHQGAPGFNSVKLENFDLFIGQCAEQLNTGV